VYLIPRYEAAGAALATAVSFVATTLALLVWFRRVERHVRDPRGRGDGDGRG
jgi:hypothetical protein